MGSTAEAAKLRIVTMVERGALKPGERLGAERVLVVHGLTDVVTPYLETQMVLDQIPDYGRPERVAFKVYAGGHMFYSRDESRAKFRDDARALYAP